MSTTSVASATSGASSSTTSRLTGIYSGLDTDSIVTSLMATDQTKVDKQYQTETKLEWKADALRAVNKSLKTFRESYLSVLNSGSNMLSRATYKANTVTMNTNTSAVSITASSTAAAATMTIDSIEHLATNAQVKGNVALSGTVSTDTALADLVFTNPLVFDESGNISFSINDTSFTFSKTDTLGDMMNKINSSDAGVTMRYSSLSKGFYLTSNTTGSDSQVKIENTSGNAFGSSGAFGISEGTTHGTNAVLTIDGTEVEESSNSFAIDGVTYTLKSTSDEAVSFTISRDIDGIYDKISTFIDAYNALVSDLTSQLTEKSYSLDYPPLTEAQQKSMTETQIDAWNEKAKSGLLRNDGNIESLLSSMRSAFYSAVEGAGISAADIGITTESYTTTGEISINKDALKAALEKNPDQVMNLFVNTSTSTDSATAFKESGLITRISNAMLNYYNNAADVTLSSLDDQIDKASSKLSDMKDWLTDREESYYEKFSKMESALSKMASTSNWLSSLVDSWNAKSKS